MRAGACQTRACRASWRRWAARSSPRPGWWLGRSRRQSLARASCCRSRLPRRGGTCSGCRDRSAPECTSWPRPDRRRPVGCHPVRGRTRPGRGPTGWRPSRPPGGAPGRGSKARRSPSPLLLGGLARRVYASDARLVAKPRRLVSLEPDNLRLLEITRHSPPPGRPANPRRPSPIRQPPTGERHERHKRARRHRRAAPRQCPARTGKPDPDHRSAGARDRVRAASARAVGPAAVQPSGGRAHRSLRVRPPRSIRGEGRGWPARPRPEPTPAPSRNQRVSNRGE